MSSAIAPTRGQQTTGGTEVAEDPLPPLAELVLDGTTQLGLFDAGGKQPTSATVRLTGRRIELADGRGFRKGETVRLQVTAVIDRVSLKDTRDAETGIVVACEQAHEARIVDIRLA